MPVKKDDKPTVKAYEEMTPQEKAVDDYQTGRYSIQDIARIHSLEVDEVLQLTGNGEIGYVRFVGDQIDDGGPGVTINQAGTVYKQSFTKN